MSVAVTLEDVRAALDGDPRQTNASVVRQRLGRGSFATIQKHLVRLREEAAGGDKPGGVNPQAAPPPVPEEVLNGFRAAWSAAFVTAERHFSQRVARLETERDALSVELTTARADLEAAAAAVEAAEEERQRAEEARAEAEAAARRAEEVRAAAEAEAAAARQQLAVVEARAERDQAVLRAELDRLITQLADYRAALMSRVEAPS